MRKLEKFKKPLAILINTIFILQIAFLGVLFLPQNASANGSHILINEILPNPSGSEPDNEWIELYNPTGTSIDLFNYSLGDEETEGGTEGMYKFPEGSTITSNNFLVIANKSTNFFATYGFRPDFEFNDNDPIVPDLIKYSGWSSGQVALNNTGDEVILLDSSDLPIDTYTYLESISDESIGRYIDGSYKWVVFSDPTPGKPNSLIKIDIPQAGYYNSATWPAEISGTVSEGGLDIENVQISIFDGEKYWSESDWVSEETWIDVSGTESWAYPFIPDKEGNFTISSRVIDLENFIYEDASVSNVIYDNTPPQFQVSITPDPVRIGKIEIKVVSSEGLREVPVLDYLNARVTQNGYLPEQIVMTQKSTTDSPYTYTGEYTVISGYDGEAKVEVSGKDLAGNSNGSIVTFMVDTVNPSSPGWIIATPYNGKVNLSWEGSSDNQGGAGIGGYKVYYGPQSNPTERILDVGNVTGTFIYNLNNGISYYFYVAAYDKAGNESNPSVQVSTLLVAPPSSILPINLFSTPVYAAPSEISEKPEEVKGDEVAIGTGEKKEKEGEPLQEKRLSVWTVVLLLTLLFIGLYFYSGQKGKLLGWFAKVRSKR